MVAVLGAVALWFFVVLPLIRAGMGTGISAAAEALCPSADPTSTMLQATKKARDVLDAHIEAYLAYSGASWETIDAGVRAGIEAQMMVVTMSVTLLNIAIQDVACDQGEVDRIALATGGKGFPKLKVSDQAWSAALRDLWDRFSVPTRMNLDMRYRYFYRERLATGGEATLFARMTEYASRTLTNEFSYGQHRDTEWLAFVGHLAKGEVGEASVIATQMA